MIWSRGFAPDGDPESNTYRVLFQRLIIVFTPEILTFAINFTCDLSPVIMMVDMYCLPG